ncbi:membrane protein [Mycobacterium lepromatosis]|uniref:Transmembrane protein n=1 Tax=Mycobacterium lepromatosis TaxID=480418 RepID=A0A0F4EPE7_9MYCO|nr:hypothetical protein MLPM_2141 [Mycobacterium lepromatosis]UKN43008.1 membrane protein [Mycobacterium lepromatosis]
MLVEPDRSREPPPLPPMLLEVWPVIAVGALSWLIAVAAAFVVPGLQSWRPVTVAGLVVGLLGAGIFVWQLAAARRGARGAQDGLETYLNPPVACQGRQVKNPVYPRYRISPLNRTRHKTSRD